MAEINCYGVIDEGFAQELRRAVTRIPKHEPIELHISSPGGILAEGVTCYNILRRAPNEVIGYMDGDAFSAATLLVCACDHVDMPANTLMMVHDPWLPALAPATISELRKATSYLRATKAQCLEIYAEKTGISQRKIGKMMQDETYLNAKEAMGLGFVHNVTAPRKDVQVRALDEYTVRDRDRLATMLGKRRIPRDVSDLLDSICRS
jgi:ATP-dependent protease ClpP protease subunit